MNLTEHLSNAWAERYSFLAHKVQQAEKNPVFFKPLAVRQWKGESREALKYYQFFLTEV
jgi:hypothetical protein